MSIRITAEAPGGVPLALDVAATAARLGTTDTAAVTELIRQITDLCERLAKLAHIWYRTYEAALEGDNEDRLYLPAGRPLAVVTSVKAGVDGTALVEGTGANDDYEVWKDEGYLLNDNCWASGLPHWRAAYSGGWWTPSMGDDAAALAAGAKTLANDSPHIELAIWQAVNSAWYQNYGKTSLFKAIGVKRADIETAKFEFFAGQAIPTESLDVFRSIGPLAL